MHDKAKLALKAEPDGFGFIYGTLTGSDGECRRVDIMPPLPCWRGDIKLGGNGAPHPTDWVVYLDGEEVARVSTRDDLEAAVLAALPRP